MRASVFIWILLNLIIPFDIFVKNGRSFWLYLGWFVWTSFIGLGIYTAVELGGGTQDE